MRNNYQHTIYASYLGYITQAIVNIFTPLLFLILMDEFGFSLRQITLIPTINFAVQLCVDMFSAKFVDRIGYRISILGAHFFAAAGLIGLAILPPLFPDPYIGLMIAVVMYAIGGGIIEVLISPIVESCPTDNKETAMSLLHSFYCWGSVAVILLSTLFLYVFGKGNWRILACLWAVLPGLNFLYFTQVPINTLVENNESMSVTELFKSRLFLIFFVMMIASGASELSMSQWASAFAERSLGIPKTVGDLTGACFFSILMGFSRTLYGKVGDRLDLLKCMLGCAVLCIAAYMLIVLAPVPAMSLLGIGLVGLAVGIMWPGVFSLASANMPKGGTAMFAILALAGDVGCSTGPTLVGLVSGAAGGELKAGLMAAALFPIILLTFGLMLRRYLSYRS